jgi:elongation factor P
MINATELRKGMVIRHADQNWVVVKSDHVTRGNWRSYMQTKLRHVENGTIVDERFRSDERVERVFIDQKDLEYLYGDAHHLFFMDQESYEQTQIPREVLGDDAQWLKENTMVKVSTIDGRAVSVELPTTVNLKVVETEPGIKGATVTNVFKPAKLETGATVQVPPFIDMGEVVTIDTRDGHYVGRANA